MSPAYHSTLDDDHIVRYLLDLLPAEARNRLDEASVVDGGTALRLSMVENDLVDAYVRGTIGIDMHAQFERFYLASHRRRRKVRMARTILDAADRLAAGPWPDCRES